MLLFIIGTPGIGKTSVAQELKKFGFIHHEVDSYRTRLGASTTTNPAVEDAISWRIFSTAILELRQGKSVVIDSTGASKRLPFLRTAFDKYPQKVVCLSSSFPYAACTRKWGNSYSLEKFEYLAKKISEVQADFNLLVDQTTPIDVAQNIVRLIGSG